MEEAMAMADKILGSIKGVKIGTTKDKNITAITASGDHLKLTTSKNKSEINSKITSKTINTGVQKPLEEIKEDGNPIKEKKIEIPNNLTKSHFVDEKSRGNIQFKKQKKNLKLLMKKFETNQSKCASRREVNISNFNTKFHNLRRFRAKQILPIENTRTNKFFDSFESFAYEISASGELYLMNLIKIYTEELQTKIIKELKYLHKFNELPTEINNMDLIENYIEFKNILELYSIKYENLSYSLDSFTKRKKDYFKIMNNVLHFGNIYIPHIISYSNMLSFSNNNPFLTNFSKKQILIKEATKTKKGNSRILGRIINTVMEIYMEAIKICLSISGQIYYPVKLVKEAGNLPKTLRNIEKPIVFQFIEEYKRYTFLVFFGETKLAKNNPFC